jgi:hypothetical protein
MKLWRTEVSYQLRTKSYPSVPNSGRVKAGSARGAVAKALAQGLQAPKGKRVQQYFVTVEDLGKETVV